ncbi:hypothetical protein BDV96DRAFT_22158 [Lophiotrema nucula]|uniref:Uncharacterized protein n=1 Tax=Lophiotrema nucula TaxID=690887 RepID=A0A6A5ZCM5_9PLEO|nr:hypothetical protein BDV96DRAFT_22158 [Lophiotrema nucula]
MKAGVDDYSGGTLSRFVLYTLINHQCNMTGNDKVVSDQSSRVSHSDRSDVLFDLGHVTSHLSQHLQRSVSKTFPRPKCLPHIRHSYDPYLALFAQAHGPCTPSDFATNHPPSKYTQPRSVTERPSHASNILMRKDAHGLDSDQMQQGTDGADIGKDWPNARQEDRR